MQRPYANPSNYPPEAEANKPEDTLSAQAKAKTKQAQEESLRLMEKAKEKGRSLLAERKRAIADEIAGMADALHKFSDDMRQSNQPLYVSPYAERAADGLERFSQALQERDLGSLVNQVGDFARRQPGMFIGGSVAVGFMLARFLRSSAAHSERDYAHSSTTSGESQASHTSHSQTESAASDRPDVIYAPPPSEAATLTPAMQESSELPTGRTRAVLFEEEATIVGLSDEDKLSLGPTTPAAENAAKVVFEKPEIALSAEADPAGVGEKDEPSTPLGRGPNT